MGQKDLFCGIEKGFWYGINCAKKVKWNLFDTFKKTDKYRLVRDNRKFMNCHKGERVFVVANGPSIKTEKLGLLKGEKIFTVNQMIRKAEFVELNPICNFWADPAYFDENMPNESKKEFEELFQKTCHCGPQIVNFVPVCKYQFMKKHNLIFERVHFIDTSLYFYDGYSQNIRFDRLAPAFQNIVQFAVAMAIYMGFSEIYILGADSTGIITKINSVLSQNIEGCYTYDLGRSGQKYVNSLLDYFSVEEQFAGWTRIFHLYKELFRYCNDHNIKLVNCSSETIIEGIPRASLESVISNEANRKIQE